MLTALSVMLRTAVEWELIKRIPCTIKLLKTPKNAVSFHDFDECERLVEAVKSDRQAQLVVLPRWRGRLALWGNDGARVVGR